MKTHNREDGTVGTANVRSDSMRGTAVTTANVQKAIDEVYQNIFRANNAFRRSVELRTADAEKSYVLDEEHIAEYYSQAAYVQLMALLEALGMFHLHGMVAGLYEIAERQEKNWLEGEMGPDDLYLVWAGKLHVFTDALRTLYAKPAESVVSKDVENVLRACLYSITDKVCFELPPAQEADVHHRIEAVLRCVFPDLLHKPSLNKPIKNFEPDTGLPSIRTLVEYKFISTAEDAKRVADEVLADTRGYVSSEWDSFFYVIYETKRLRPEVEWEGLLRAADVPHNTKIIVLSGEDLPPSNATPKQAKKQRRRRTGARQQ